MNATIITLGCRLNQADAALISDRLEKAGYTIVEAGSEKNVDLVVINSCAVTGSAVSKSRQALAKYRKIYPEAEIIFTGCAAEVEYEKFSADERLSSVITNIDKREIANRVGMHRKPRFSTDASNDAFAENAIGRFHFRHRALVKIQEGCNNFCSYCIVPLVRGPERSRKVGEVLAECEKLVEAKVPEIVLTGVNTCAYSSDGYDLGRLVNEICSFDGEFRVRLSSTEPHMNNISLLENLAECKDKFCRFLHLSLQHGDDEILGSMRRHYTTGEFAEFAAKAREIWPLLHLGTDVIVGFPGENETQFAASLAFIEKMEFANIHIFSYSPRPGTDAAKFPGQVPNIVAKRRHGELDELAKKSATAFRQKNKNLILPVIFEEEKCGILHGWSDNYLSVETPSNSAEIGKITQIRL